MQWDPTTHYKDVAVAERYDRERFSRLTGRIFDKLEKRALRRAFVGVPRSSLVLDLPCGTGRLAETLLEQGFRVVGVDISPAMLAVASRKLQRFDDRFDTLVSDVHDLARTSSGAYDVALCARVLMHFPLPSRPRSSPASPGWPSAPSSSPSRSARRGSGCVAGSSA